jgi:hypothetical protein
VTTVARIFGVLLIALGLTYGSVAAYSLFNAEGTAAFLEATKAPEHQEFGFRSIEDWKEGVVFNSWLFLALGAVAAICGAGIAARKEWARRSWLLTSALLIIFVIVVAAANGEVWKRYIELLAFSLPSFALLIRSFEERNSAI